MKTNNFFERTTSCTQLCYGRGSEKQNGNLKWNFPLSVGPLRILKNKNREDVNLCAGKAIALVADLPSLKNLSGGFSFATRKVRGWFKTR